MQKPANRILGMLLALVMIMTMLPATVFASSETDVFAGWSLTLGEDIGVNFYLSEEAANYTVSTTVAGNAANYTTATKDGYYVVSVNVAAAQMTDVITLNVVNGETLLHTGEYSVRQYAEKILTGEYDDAVKELVMQMLNLGAAAQTYFAYNTDPLANEGYEIDTPATVPTEIPAINLEDNLDGVSLYGMSLLFQSKTAVRFYFVVEGDVANYTFKVGETVYAPVQKDGLYFVEVGNINPQDLDQAVTVTVNDALSVSYNPLTYIVRKYNDGSSSNALKNLVQAMYGYHLEAKEYDSIIWAGTMSSHSNGWSADALYFSMAENEAPIGDAIRYIPEAESNLQLIRDGVTYNVGHTARETIVKSSDTGYYIALWVLGDYKPLQENDILIVSGNFTNAANNTTLNISKSYVLINADGTASFSTEMPTLPTIIDAGVMSEHSNGWSADALYFSMAENEAPIGDAIRYIPEAESNLQLIRDGVTYNVGHTARETIVKSSDTGYYIALWVMGDYKPLVANDILVVEGNFTNAANKTTLNISKSYVLINADGTASFSTEMPTLATVIDAGTMSAHSTTGWKSSAEAAGNLLFAMADNDAPSGYYRPTDASNVQLIRDGNTYVVGHNQRDTIAKENNAQYVFEFWTIADHKPMVANDILVVEGSFYQESTNTMLNISKTYILLNDDGTATFSTEMPVLKTVVNAGAMSEHADGTAEEIYFSLADNSVPVDESAEIAYAGSVQLVSGGNTSSVNANIYKLDEGYYYLELDGVELADGDYLVVEGAFSNADNGYTLNITKTYVLVDGESLVYSETEPDLSASYDVGVLQAHNAGAASGGIYFKTAEANDAPWGDWNTYYDSASVDNVKLIRNGETISVGLTDRNTICKFGQNDYYLRLENWTIGDYAPYTTDDMFIVEGAFTHKDSNTTLNITKTYIYHNGASWVLASSLPVVYNAGTMQTHEAGLSNLGIYFRTAANDAPYNSDWTLEYNQTSVDNIKLIRDGVTTSIGIVDRPMFVRLNETDYYLKLEGWTIGEYGLNYPNPITTDDMLIIEGNFFYAAENVTLNIQKSYVYYNGVAWVCSAEEPVQKTIVDVVELGSHSNGWASGGIYFTAAANAAPYDTTWALRYTPVSADAIKVLNADGTTTNVGNTGAETIVKFSETDYYIEGWAVGSANIAASNTIVIDGLFYNAANDVYIDVEKTYIILNQDGVTTILTDSDKYINAGAMSAYTQNWFDTNYTALYFVLASNTAPANEDWSVRYKPASANNVKLVRGGETYTIGNTGAETIIKIADGKYALALDSWWWSSYAPIQDGDQLIIEGEFANSSNGYILNIDKTYITFVSNADDNVVFNAAADTDFGDVLLPSSNDTLTIGVWNGSYHVFEDKQLQELQAAGITKIMGIDTQWIGTTDVNAWLDRVYSYGISVIFDLRSWDGTTVPDYATHPGVLGFLMYDEPSTKNFEDLADLKTKFDAVMPAGKLFYVNLFPECAADSALFGSSYNLFTDYDKYYVTKFLETLDIEVLSWDNYSLITDSTKTATGIRTDYFHNFEVMAAKNKTLWYTMLSAGHGTSHFYNTPTADELRWQMAVAMTYGVQNIDHYIYTSHEEDYSCMVEYDTWNTTDLYDDIVTVDNEYLAWDNIFMAYDWVGVGTYSANSNNSMLSQLENSLPLSDYGVSVSASENLLVGVFDYNGDKAYMVTNAGSVGTTTVGDGKNFSMADTTVTLTLADGDYKCAAVIDNGEITYVAVNNNTVTLNVEAYEGVFVIPVLN